MTGIAIVLVSLWDRMTTRRVHSFVLYPSSRESDRINLLSVISKWLSGEQGALCGAINLDYQVLIVSDWHSMDIEEYENTYIIARYGRARRKINFNDVPVHLKLSDN